MAMRQNQVRFRDGHVRAFAHFDAVPQRIAYDNLKSAVRRMLVGSEREMTERFAGLVARLSGWKSTGGTNSGTCGARKKPRARRSRIERRQPRNESARAAGLPHSSDAG